MEHIVSAIIRILWPAPSCLLPYGAMHSAVYAVARCLSVCLSVTRRYCVETAKRILKPFSPSGSHTIIVFPHQTPWKYSTGTTLTGTSMKIFRPISRFVLEMIQDRATVTMECE